MNEILQKRIEEKSKELAQKYFPNEMNVWARKNLEAQYVESACKEIATFALQNQWISVDEALPPIREKDIENRSWSKWVLIMTHEGGAFVDCYAFHRKEWLNNGNDVTHWMQIPQLKGGKE